MKSAMRNFLGAVIVMGCMCSACTAEPSPTFTPSPIASPTSGLTPPAPKATITTTPQPSATSLPTQGICSPLEGYTLSELPGLVSNPYAPPPLGSDDVHQGVDLADRAPGSEMAVPGRNVQAALAGKVVMVTHERFPYGNAILIETPLERLPAAFAPLPTPVPTIEPERLHLICPAEAWQAPQNTKPRSVYTLYAHLLHPSDLKPDESVTCGQNIGQVGASGNALNPHLHLEMRAGPSGASFTSMAHYDNSATPAEMAAYCAWRVSGWFQHFSPLNVLSLH